MERYKDVMRQARKMMQEEEEEWIEVKETRMHHWQLQK